MKQIQLGEVDTLKHDKKVVINVKFGIDSKGEIDYSVSAEGNICSAHSSGGDFNEPTLLEGLKKCLSWYCEDYLKEGYKQENIIIKKEFLTKEEFDEWVIMREEEKKRDLDYLKKDLDKLKGEFTKKLLQQKELNKPKDYRIIWEKFARNVENTQ